MNTGARSEERAISILLGRPNPSLLDTIFDRKGTPSAFY